MQKVSPVPKTPILKYGALHCPYCFCPLIIEEPRPEEYHCVYCKSKVGKLTDEIMIALAKTYPVSTMRERLLEMRSD